MLIKRCLKVGISFVLCGCVFGAAVEGELKVWHNVTLSFDGPQTSEQATPNPFMDYRLDVTFTGPSGQQYAVPGYYAADGDAANTSADSGDQWCAHLAPDEAGEWTWEASFRKGEIVAVNDDPAAGESAGFMDGEKGSFEIKASDKSGRDFRGKGRLDYVGGHYLQFAGSKEYFLKCGPDAPETFLAYADFDGTKTRNKNVPLKTWQPHVQDWKTGDPTWQDGKGKGVIGALNYLSDKGINAFSFLTYNAGGDGDNVWPFCQRDDKFRYDCSKLDQWQIVFDHAQAGGLYLHFKTQETENDDNRTKDADRVVESLDGGDLGPERKLYCRELIARFGYALALNWNLGEENTQTTEQQKAMAAYFAKHDPYKHHIVVHTYPGQWEKIYKPLLGNASDLTGASLQNDWQQTHQRTLQWINASAKAGKPWVVANDEQGPAKWGAVPDTGYQGFDPAATTGYSMHDIRQSVLWGNLMAGGAGVEYYFGYELPENDLKCEDYRSRDTSWDYGRIALEFFDKQQIPFWEMKSADDLTWQDNDYCFIKDGVIYLIYQKQGGPLNLDLSDGDFEYGYFNPRTGEGADELLHKKKIEGPRKYAFQAPDRKDWLLVIRSSNGGKVIQTEKPKPQPMASDIKGGLSLSAINDFTVISDDGFVPAYKDDARKALAINAAQHKDKFAAAETTYNGNDGTFTLVLTAMTETDGESTYKLFVNSKQLSSAKQNPATSEDYKKVYHLWENAALKKGDKIQVQFNSASNKRIPEGDNFAYSRGRWTGLTIADPAEAKTLNAAKTTPKEDVYGNIIKVESLFEGQIFEEKDGLLAVEAEHFSQQEKTDKRKWYITASEGIYGITPDGDPSHAASASGGAYIENLPDTRRTHGDKLTGGVNFSNTPGQMAVLSYPVVINNPGRYYVWVRAYSTGSEDNGLHAGIDGTWPESGARLQWCEGKNSWRWESKQRTEKVHCGEPYKIFLDIEKTGPHLVQFSMREDGFEFDKFILTQDKEFTE